MKLEIDFSKVAEIKSMHSLLKKEFGFPDFYGGNVNALIDCWSSLRSPEDEMSTIILGKDEQLTLILKEFPMHDYYILNNFFIAVKSVNQRFIDNKEQPPILLLFV